MFLKACFIGAYADRINSTAPTYAFLDVLTAPFAKNSDPETKLYSIVSSFFYSEKGSI